MVDFSEPWIDKHIANNSVFIADGFLLTDETNILLERIHEFEITNTIAHYVQRSSNGRSYYWNIMTCIPV